jgi:amino acid transporter
VRLMNGNKQFPRHNLLLAETEPQKLLPRVLGRFDLVAFYFAIIFGSYGAAQMASQGWAGIPMMLLATVTFLIPCALGSYELGTLFPSEGGIYVWTHKIFGPIHGFIAGWLSWCPIFLLLPLDVAVIASHLQFIFHVTWSVHMQVLCQIGLVWLLFLISIFRVKVSANIVKVMFFVAMTTAFVALAAGLVHIHAPVTPVTSDIFSFNLHKYGFLYSAAVLWLLGVEIPYNMGAEYSEHKKTGKTMLLWGTATLLIGYLIGIVGILLTTQVASIDQTTGIARTAATISPVVGIIVAIGICLSVFGQETSTMNAYSRLLFIGAIEKHVPKRIAKVSVKEKVPWLAMLFQTIGASIVILIFTIQTQLAVAFNIYLAALVAIWCASLFYIYFGLLKVRTLYKDLYTERGSEVWQIPGGKFGVWAIALIGAFFNGLAIYYVFAKPWVDGISLYQWRLWLSLISALIICIGIVVYFIPKIKGLSGKRLNS